MNCLLMGTLPLTRLAFRVSSEWQKTVACIPRYISSSQELLLQTAVKKL